MKLTIGTLEVRNAGDTDDGEVTTKELRISGPTVPGHAGDTGTAGDIAWDSGYIYVCVATNTWKRVAIATWV